MPRTVVTRNAQLAQGLQLGQARPGDANAASLYSPADGIVTKVTNIAVCNTTGNTPSYRIFHDEDGATYDQTTALYYDNAMAANETEIIDVEIYMANSSGNLAVRTSAASEITFTAYGEETQVRAR